MLASAMQALSVLSFPRESPSAAYCGFVACCGSPVAVGAAQAADLITQTLRSVRAAAHACAGACVVRPTPGTDHRIDMLLEPLTSAANRMLRMQTLCSHLQPPAATSPADAHIHEVLRHTCTQASARSRWLASTVPPRTIDVGRRWGRRWGRLDMIESPRPQQSICR